MVPSTQVSPPQSSDLLTRIRLCLGLIMAGLALTGLTAFPLVRESQWLLDHLAHTAHFGVGTPLFAWFLRIHLTFAGAAGTAPFLAYGADWIGVAHLLFAGLFLGPYRDPVRNRWVIDFGLISCVGLLLLTFISGPLRGIPVFWRGIDAAFATACAFLLLLCRHYLHIFEHLAANVRRHRSQKIQRLRQRRKTRDRRSVS